MKEQISSLKEKFIKALGAATTNYQLEEVRITYLGRKGHIATLMDTLKTLGLEEKKEYGPLLNELKQHIQDQFNAKKHQITVQQQSHAQALKQFFDVTAYIPEADTGSLHPMTQVLHHVQDIFLSMGYEIADGPEVETEYYNFEALNIAKDHPAREMWDTLWLDIPSLLLRTHTSPVQVRALEKKQLPLALVAPGRCYRHEATDASHDFVFMQVEGLLVDKQINLGHLLATIKSFMQTFFEKEKLDIRIRPSYFPFVKPGIEIDIECPFCNHGCSVCKETEWIEACGAGLVHPNVLEFSGIDAKEQTGFAFGFGLTRLAMLKFGINDIRLLHSGNIEFLKQF